MNQFPNKSGAGGNMDSMMLGDSMTSNKRDQNQSKQMGQMLNVMDGRGQMGAS